MESEINRLREVGLESRIKREIGLGDVKSPLTMTDLFRKWSSGLCDRVV